MPKEESSFDDWIDKRIGEALWFQPPPGTARRVLPDDENQNLIIVWANGSFTVIGNEAWRLYEAMQNIKLRTKSPFRTVKVLNLRSAIEHCRPSKNIVPLMARVIRVEAELSGADFTSTDWFPAHHDFSVALRHATPDEEAEGRLLSI